MGRKCIERVEAQQWTAQANRNEAARSKELPLGDALHEFPPLDQLPFESYLKHAGAIDILQELGYTYSEVNECWEAPRVVITPLPPEPEKPGLTFYLFVLLASAAGAYLTIRYAT